MAKNPGNYYKKKTKEFFIAKGYACDYVEKLQQIYIPKQKKVIYLKRDLFGADVVAMNGEEIIFANSKFGRSNLSAGLKEFAKFPFPVCVKRWLVVWEPRVKEPEIIDVQEREREAQGLDPQ